MSDKIIENNQAEITGIIVSEFIFSHKTFGEEFYSVYVSVERESGTCDIIPVTVSERLIDVAKNREGEKVNIYGQFRSYNLHEEGKSRLILSVFAREVNILEEDYETNDNQIFLDGYICKIPKYRKTPNGREISDILLAVNRPYGKSDYIPCIAWGRNARYASGFKVGTHVIILGRVQSREYEKKLDDSKDERRIAYEVSIREMEVVNNE